MLRRFWDVVWVVVAASLLAEVNLATLGEAAVTGLAALVATVIAFPEVSLTIAGVAAVHWMVNLFTSQIQKDPVSGIVKLPAAADGECGGVGLLCRRGGSASDCPCEPDEDKCKRSDKSEQEYCEEDACNSQDGTCMTDGCPCKASELLDVHPINFDWLDGQQTWLQAVAKAINALPPAPKNRPADHPYCSGAGLTGLPARANLATNWLINDGAHKSDTDLVVTMRQTLCTNQCQIPDGNPSQSARATPLDGDGCELAIDLITVGAVMEGYASRSGPSTGDLWQDYWDSLWNITFMCINWDQRDTSGASLSQGSVVRPKQDELFAGGFIPRNAPEAAHTVSRCRSGAAT